MPDHGTICRIGLLALVSMVPFQPAAAAPKSLLALPVPDAVNMKHFGEFSPVAFSPQGPWLVYVTRDKTAAIDEARSLESGVPWNASSAQISIVNIDTGESSEVTHGIGDNWLPVWSPDGSDLAFLSDRDRSGGAKLWLWSSHTGRLRKLSDVNLRAERIEWTPDGRSIVATILPMGLSRDAYATKVLRGGAAQNAGYDKEQGSTALLYKPSPDGDSTKGAPQSNPWNLDAYVRDLAIFRVATGEVKVIVHGRRIAAFAISHDGSQVAYTIPKGFEKPGSQQTLFDLAIINLASGSEMVAASMIRIGYDGEGFSWSPDGHYLSYCTGGLGERSFACFVLSSGGENPRNITNLAQDVTKASSRSATPLWDKEGRHIYFINGNQLWSADVGDSSAKKIAAIPGRQILQALSQDKDLLWTLPGRNSTVVLTYDETAKQDGFYEVNLTTGASASRLERAECYTCASQNDPTTVSGDGKWLAYFSEDSQDPSDLWITDLTFRNPKRVTDLNPQFDRYELGAVRSISWLDDDGEQLNGALLLPVGYREGIRYPLVVWVYGGAGLSNNLHHFGLAGTGPFNMQLLATRGYAVLLPDAPLHLGTPALDLIKTVLPGVSRVVVMGIADGERVGVLGHSGGGYDTLALIAQTARFKAAVDIDGMGDLTGLYGEMDESGAAFATSILESGLGGLGGGPWDVPERYLQNSPVFHLNAIETPLLIVHGARDTTVESFLADEIFVGLRRLGRPVEYAKYEGEDHSPPFWSRANQIDLSNRIIRWFDAHLKGPAH